MIYKCMGSCGRTVSGPEQWCSDSECWPPNHTIEGIIAAVVNKAPERRTPERESLRTRLSILNLAHAYALGPESDRERNLNQLVHLTQVAQHEHELEKEKQ